MAGWWAQFPGQHPPDLDFSESEQYALVDGPELDPSNPPQLPLEGQATYIGPGRRTLLHISLEAIGEKTRAPT